MKFLSNYKIIEQLHECDNIGTYRATRLSDESQVLLKIAGQKGTSDFHREYDILRVLDIEGIIKPISIEGTHNPVIVYEDLGYITLRLLLSRRQLSIDDFFQLAQSLLNTVELLHRNGIIHSGIKAENIFILENGNLSAVLGGFENFITFEDIERHQMFPYVEQVSLERDIPKDHRIDIYALGVLFYEMLTGKIVVNNAPVSTPPSHFRPDIANKLDGIIIKMLSQKLADNYQMVQHVKDALMGCQGGGVIYDTDNQELRYESLKYQKLYGRTKEIALLIDGFLRAHAGNSDYCILKGAQGIGKRTLVHEFVKTLSDKTPVGIVNVDFAKKHAAFKPYGGFFQALTELTIKIVANKCNDAAFWQECYRFLGSNMMLIIELLPPLKDMQIHLTTSKSSEATTIFSHIHGRHRLYMAVGDFLSFLSMHFKPLLIFLDGVENIDRDFCRFIEFFILHKKTEFFMFILLYTEKDDVGVSEQLKEILHSVRQEGKNITEILIQPLDTNHIGELLADTLHTTIDRASTLAFFLEQISGGNPSHLHALLGFLHEEGIFQFDYNSGTWDWDIKKLKNNDITTDIKDIITSKLNGTPGKSMELLAYALAIEEPFTQQTLIRLSQSTEKDVTTFIGNAIFRELLVEEKGCLSASKTLLTEDSTLPRYVFFNKIVKDTLHMYMPHSLIKEAHANIARNIINTHIFNALYHLTEAGDMVEYTYYLNAGKEANKLYASNLSLRLLDEGLTILKKNLSNTASELKSTALTALIEASFMANESQLMDGFISETKGVRFNIDDAIKNIEIKILSLIGKESDFEIFQLTLQLLKILRINPPTISNKYILKFNKQIPRLFMPVKSLKYLSNLQSLKKPYVEDALRAIQNIHSSYGQLFSDSSIHIILSELAVSIKYGTCSLSVLSYVKYACLLCNVFEQVDDGYEYGTFSLELSKGIDVVNVRVYYFYYTFIFHHKESVKNSIQNLKYGYEKGLQVGDFEYSMLCALTLCAHYFCLGMDFASLESLCREFAIRASCLHSIHISQMFELHADTCLKLIGDNNSDNVHVIKEEKSTKKVVTVMYLHRAVVNYIYGEIERALNYVFLAENTPQCVTGTVYEFLLYYYSSLIMIASYNGAPKKRQQEFSTRLIELQKIMYRWVLHAPSNYEHKYNLVLAEYMKVVKKSDDIATLYEQAVEKAKEEGFIFDEALASELCAKYALSLGRNKVAVMYLENALKCYRQCKGIIKAKNLEEKYADLLAPFIASENENTTNTLQVEIIPLQVEQEEITDLANKLFAQTHTVNVYKNILSLTLEYSGASRAILFVDNHGRLLEEVEGSFSGSVKELGETFEDTGCYPYNFINIIAGANDEILINNESGLESMDDYQYFKANNVKSLLCLSILKEERLKGILYLESSNVEGLFTQQKLRKLKMLSTLAAIAIENLTIYTDLTKKLSKVIENFDTIHKELEQSQKHLIEVKRLSDVSSISLHIFQELLGPLKSSLVYNSQISEILTKMDNTHLTELNNKLLINLAYNQEMIRCLSTIGDDLKNYNKRLFNIHSYVEDLLLLLSPIIKKTPHTITATCDNSIEIEGYPGAYALILIRLIMNSLNYSFTKEQKGKIFIEAFNTLDGLTLLYRDNGLGINKDILDEVFDPVRKITTDVGFDFYIVKNTVQEVLSGELRYQSSEEGGVAFVISIPR
ncbi:MAG: AAA family ATPase [Candidatus Magnetoovum sp. WYHC-5]|nr:AAA family ATPase [Candidatus Magnetoovum sp. WYHC-5]